MDYRTLMDHSGHNIVVASYGNPMNPLELSLECEDCNEVLCSFERPDGFQVPANYHPRLIELSQDDMMENHDG